ncbi:hypothetical protein Tco_0857649 [Tanacetum coccineum]|uniref:Uncharacterized protein n=1 Tax=Tanacetum coccineum TaxID=301880 RepID=A0ABQ5B920_9ASTR
MISERWSKEVRRYHFEALNGIHHWEEDIIDFFKARMSAVTEENIYSDLRIKSVIRVVAKKKWGYGFLTSIVVRRSDDKEYEFSYADLPRLNVNDVEDMYLLQVQDKLHHLPLEFVKDFNNALLMFIRRIMIKNRFGARRWFSWLFCLQGGHLSRVQGEPIAKGIGNVCQDVPKETG